MNHNDGFILDQQIRRLEHDFLKHGDMRERISRARKRRRQ
jgi:four helix bundle suffix protein